MCASIFFIIFFELIKERDDPHCVPGLIPGILAPRYPAAVRHLGGDAPGLVVNGRRESQVGLQPGQRGSPERSQPGEHHQPR